MKTVVAVAVAVLVVAPASFAVGVARDPRVPAIQRQVKLLTVQSAKLKAAVSDIQYRQIGQICQAFFSAGRESTSAELQAEPVASRIIGAPGLFSTTGMCLTPGPPP